MRDTSIDMQGKRIGNITVIAKQPYPFAASTGTYWECICELCQARKCHTGNRLRTWEDELALNPDRIIACAPCQKRRRNKLRVLKTEHKHAVAPPLLTAPKKPRKPVPICDKCCNLNSRRHWHHPCAGRMSHTGAVCGARSVGEPKIRAVATIGSAGAQCIVGVGYSRDSGGAVYG